jgi:hypothetical protein
MLPVHRPALQHCWFHDDFGNAVHIRNVSLTPGIKEEQATLALADDVGQRSSLLLPANRE